MMTLYVAGPMTGLPAHNYPAFDAAQDTLRAAGFHVATPTVIGRRHGYDKPHSFYLRRALALMLGADGIAVLPGWEGSRGARLEVYVGRSLDMPWRTVADWLDRAERAA